MKLIVAVDAAWGIGCDNHLLYAIPEDMAFFRETTKEKVVVMGRRTLQSLPQSRPLKNRINIVLTQQVNLNISGAITCHSLRQLAGVLALCVPEEVYVIGGHAIYQQLLEYCDEALVTKISANATADRHFPNLDATAPWVLVSRSEEKVHNGLRYRFCTYQNPSAKPIL